MVYIFYKINQLIKYTLSPSPLVWYIIIQPIRSAVRYTHNGKKIFFLRFMSYNNRIKFFLNKYKQEINLHENILKISKQIKYDIL
jgi:hypothetical protein